MNKTKIEWCDFTFNPIVGCTNGCSYCYARRMAARGLWGCDKCKAFTPHLHPERIGEPEKLRKPARIFVCSMGEIFDPAIGVHDTQYVIGRAAWPSTNQRHLFLILTKQSQIGYERLHGKEGSYWFGGGDYLPNVWVGASVDGVDQGVTDYRCERLHRLAGNGWHTFLSAEPLLGEVLLHGDPRCAACPQWLIIGAQTGPGATPPKREWVDGLLKQAEALEMPVFLKDNLLRLFPDLPRLRWLPPMPEVAQFLLRAPACEERTR